MPLLPEVGADFAIYIDPFNARGTASVVQRLLADRNEMRRLRGVFVMNFDHEHGASTPRH